GIHAVIGTTGIGEHEMARIEEAFTASSANCVVAANFAIGAVLMMKFAAMAAPFFETIEVVELHHENKVDAPSGTALTTAKRMVEARRGEPLLADPTTSSLEGARGYELPGGVRLHSLRIKGMMAHQEVVLGTTGQTLTIRHDSYDRSSFMPGVLMAVKAIRDFPGVTVGLDPIVDARLRF
ncbi:MAG: 4-hydroxy-tetrahydrodipicolinate reductase, partial [Actinomycetota bacterium]|nr:4-hydroxy-tetrahydrodipicolinate reductase [Actinomycetota bacterium]